MAETSLKILDDLSIEDRRFLEAYIRNMTNASSAELFLTENPSFNDLDSVVAMVSLGRRILSLEMDAEDESKSTAELFKEFEASML